MDRKLLHIGFQEELSGREYLEMMGFNFGDTVSTREAIIQAIKSDLYTGVFMDSLRLQLETEKASHRNYMRAIGIGLEAIRTIKERGLPILLISGATRDVLEMAKVAGVDRVFGKPCNPERYFEAAVELFGQPERAAAK